MKFRLLAAIILAFIFTHTADAQGNFEITPNNADPDLKAELSTGLSAAGTGLLGDAIDMDSGAFSLSNTDVSLPGNSSLAVAFSRSYGLDGIDYHGGVLGTWNPDVPFITARTLVTDPWKNDRCTGTLRQWFTHANLQGTQLQKANDDTWGGARMFIPGEGGKLLLEDVQGTARARGAGPSPKRQQWITGA